MTGADTMKDDSRGAVPVTLFVAYYASQRSGHTIHSPLNCLPGTGWEWVERKQRRIDVAPGQTIELNGNVARRASQQDLVDYWYQSRGRTVRKRVSEQASPRNGTR